MIGEVLWNLDSEPELAVPVPRETLSPSATPSAMPSRTGVRPSTG